MLFTEICRQNKLIQEKKDKLLKLIGEVNGKKQDLEVLTTNIQDLKEEYARKKESKFSVVHMFKHQSKFQSGDGSQLYFAFSAVYCPK